MPPAAPTGGAAKGGRRRRKNPGQLVRFSGTRPHIVDRMLALARVTAHDILCDIGCGDGRIVVHAALRTGCRAIGIDVDRSSSTLRRFARAAGVADRVEFVCAATAAHAA